MWLSTTRSLSARPLAPGGVQQLVACEHAAASAQERREQLKLQRAQVDDLAPAGSTSQRAKSTSTSSKRKVSAAGSTAPRRRAALMRARSSRG